MWEGYGLAVWGKREGISKQISGEKRKECAWDELKGKISLQTEKQVIHGG
jgi:hypothetical protein